LGRGFGRDCGLREYEQRPPYAVEKRVVEAVVVVERVELNVVKKVDGRWGGIGVAAAVAVGDGVETVGIPEDEVGRRFRFASVRYVQVEIEHIGLAVVVPVVPGSAVLGRVAAAHYVDAARDDSLGFVRRMRLVRRVL